MVDGKKKAKPPRPAPAPKKPENDSKTGKARGSAALAAAESDERHAAEDDDLLSSSDEQLKFKRSGTAPAQKKSLNVTKKQGKARASAALTAAENEEPDAAEAEGLPSSSDDDDSSLDKGAAGLLQLDGRKQNKKSETMSVDSNVWELRNAAAVGYGNARANTRGNAKFAAQFAASLLRERGYVCRVGDAEEVLGWLESEPFGPPSDELWRRLGMASK